MILYLFSNFIGALCLLFSYQCNADIWKDIKGTFRDTFNWRITIKNDTPYEIHTALLEVNAMDQFMIGLTTADIALTIATLPIGGAGGVATKGAAVAAKTAATAGVKTATATAAKTVTKTAATAAAKTTATAAAKTAEATTARAAATAGREATEEAIEVGGRTAAQQATRTAKAPKIPEPATVKTTAQTSVKQTKAQRVLGMSPEQQAEFNIRTRQRAMTDTQYAKWRQSPEGQQALSKEIQDIRLGGQTKLYDDITEAGVQAVTPEAKAAAEISSETKALKVKSKIAPDDAEFNEFLREKQLNKWVQESNKGKPISYDEWLQKNQLTEAQEKALLAEFRSEKTAAAAKAPKVKPTGSKEQQRRMFNLGIEEAPTTKPTATKVQAAPEEALSPMTKVEAEQLVIEKPTEGIVPGSNLRSGQAPEVRMRGRAQSIYGEEQAQLQQGAYRASDEAFEPIAEFPIRTETKTVTTAPKPATPGISPKAQKTLGMTSDEVAAFKASPKAQRTLGITPKPTAAPKTTASEVGTTTAAQKPTLGQRLRKTFGFDKKAPAPTPAPIAQATSAPAAQKTIAPTFERLDVLKLSDIKPKPMEAATSTELKTAVSAPTTKPLKPIRKTQARIPAKAQAGPETVAIPEPKPLKPLQASEASMPAKAQAGPETVAPMTEPKPLKPIRQTKARIPTKAQAGPETVAPIPEIKPIRSQQPTIALEQPSTAEEVTQATRTKKVGFAEEEVQSYVPSKAPKTVKRAETGQQAPTKSILKPTSTKTQQTAELEIYTDEFGGYIPKSSDVPVGKPLTLEAELPEEMVLPVSKSKTPVRQDVIAQVRARSAQQATPTPIKSKTTPAVSEATPMTPTQAIPETTVPPVEIPAPPPLPEPIPTVPQPPTMIEVTPIKTATVKPGGGVIRPSATELEKGASSLRAVEQRTIKKPTLDEESFAAKMLKRRQAFEMD